MREKNNHVLGIFSRECERKNVNKPRTVRDNLEISRIYERHGFLLVIKRFYIDEI